MTINPSSIGAIQTQQENTNNFLDTRFLVQISKLPYLKARCQTVSVPGASLQIAKQETLSKSIQYPAQPIEHDTLTIRFLLDEDLATYKAIWNWFKECVAYTSFSGVVQNLEEVLSQDLQVLVLDSNQNVSHRFVFSNVFPVSVGSIDLNATNTDASAISLEVRFAYTSYEYFSEQV